MNESHAGTDDIVSIIRRNELAPGQFEEHSARGVGDTIEKSLSALQGEWATVTRQIASIADATDPAVGQAGFELAEISFALGFNAKGKLAFIAEAGVEATVTVTVKRRSAAA